MGGRAVGAGRGMVDWSGGERTVLQEPGVYAMGRVPHTTHGHNPCALRWRLPCRLRSHAPAARAAPGNTSCTGPCATWPTGDTV